MVINEIHFQIGDLVKYGDLIGVVTSKYDNKDKKKGFHGFLWVRWLNKEPNLHSDDGSFSYSYSDCRLLSIAS